MITNLGDLQMWCAEAIDSSQGREHQHTSRVRNIHKCPYRVKRGVTTTVRPSV